jgi:hypothetical protein
VIRVERWLIWTGANRAVSALRNGAIDINSAPAALKSGIEIGVARTCEGIEEKGLNVIV